MRKLDSDAHTYLYTRDATPSRYYIICDGDTTRMCACKQRRDLRGPFSCYGTIKFLIKSKGSTLKIHTSMDDSMLNITKADVGDEFRPRCALEGMTIKKINLFNRYSKNPFSQT